MKPSRLAPLVLGAGLSAASLGTLGALGAVGALALGGCKKEPGPKGYDPGTTTAPAPAPAPTPPPTAAATATAPPTPSAPAPAGATAPGKVLETMNAGGYTYAKLDVGGEQVWVAGPETKLAVGDALAPVGGTLMTNFTSNTLNRTFDRIYFVGALTLVGAPAAAAAGGPHAAAPGSAAGGARPAVPGAPTEPMAPAPGGQSIAAMLATPAALAGKAVAVRGKVVKWNGNILGRNWLHLHDGTGDLTVTTAETAAPVAIGEIVVARGTLAVNKDFGSGYTYPVIVEDATLSPQ